MEFIGMSKFDVWVYGTQGYSKKKNENDYENNILNFTYNSTSASNRCDPIDKCSFLILFF